jgi:hypothetical protein
MKRDRNFAPPFENLPSRTSLREPPFENLRAGREHEENGVSSKSVETDIILANRFFE